MLKWSGGNVLISVVIFKCFEGVMGVDKQRLGCIDRKQVWGDASRESKCRIYGSSWGNLLNLDV